MEYRLKKVTKTMIYKIATDYGVVLEKRAHCQFKACKRAGFLKSLDYTVYLDTSGKVYMHVQGIYTEEDYYINPSFEYLMQHDFIEILKSDESDQTSPSDQTSQADQVIPGDQTSQADQVIPGDQISQADQVIPGDQTSQADQVIPEDQTSQADQVISEDQTSQADQAISEDQTSQADQATQADLMSPAGQVDPETRTCQPDQTVCRGSPALSAAVRRTVEYRRSAC